MRIFISLDDASGSRRTTRITVPQCSTTTHIINAICKEVGSKKAFTIIKLKNEPFHLRVVEGWPISHYPIKNGSIFIVEFCQDFTGEKLPLIQEDSDEYLTERDTVSKISFISDQGHREDLYLEDCLIRMIEAVKSSNLAKIAAVLKQQPEQEEELSLSRLMEKKNFFLINEIGDEGKNALHWAISMNNVDIVFFLLIKGSNPSILTHEEYSPLQLAVKSNSLQIVKVLLQQKLTDINSCCREGTALHLAIKQDNFDLVKILLQHDADVQVLDKKGLKPIDLCKNVKIKELLFKKSKLGSLEKRQAPVISKGTIFKVSSYMYRHKNKIMVINPYKQSLHFQDEQNFITSRYSLQSLKQVQEVREKSWLMNQEYFYFKLLFGAPNPQELLLGLKHLKTYERWILRFNSILEAMQVASLRKPVPQPDQIIEIINDQSNEIVLHKRKIKNEPVSRIFKNQSILNLPFDSNETLPPPNQSPIQFTPQRATVPANFMSSSNQPSKYKDSQIIVGSVINECSTTKSPGSQYSFPDINQQSTEELLAKSLLKTEGSSESRQKFRKQSEKIDIISDFKMEDKISVTYKDFQILSRIGSGSFGQVYLARYLRTNKLYALKVLNKRKLIAKKQLKYAVGEANIMKKLGSPFIITLHYAFETPLHLYMAIDHCPHGDLAEIIVERDQLKESTACFVIAQLILAIEYLHGKNILYRDLKPENILIASDGYIKLTDFGLSKENCFAMSFCGSPAYLSPEMLEKKGVGFESDLYGIGTVLFEMVVGEPPYFDENMDVMFENIKTGKLRYPSYLSIQIKSLMGKLLEKDASKRLGKNNFNEIKRHDFFKKLNWKHLAMKRIRAPKELFINDNDSDAFEPVNLERKQKINLQEDDYGDSSSNMMNRVSNFTFARDPETTRLPMISRNNP